jgi:cell division protein FtsA
MEGILFGLDIGTTKVCAVIGEVRGGQLRIIGFGLAPAQGMNKGMIVDVAEASVAVAKAVEQAEETSGYDLSQALVSLAGEHIQSSNSNGAVAIHRQQGGVTTDDIERALDAAQAIPIPQNREIVHLVPRHFQVDNTIVHRPLGMHGHRLEVEVHVVTGASMALMNLAKCADNVGIRAQEFVLNALASGEAVLEPNEREMDVIVADIGGGTTDIALYRQGSVYHTRVLPVGGNHVTNDIAIGLRVPFPVAEKVKVQYGDCRPAEIDSESMFTVAPFSGERIMVGRQDLAAVIEARVEEIFQMVLREIEASGYDGLLPAGIVLTGGSAQLRGITQVAQRVLNVPARVAGPRELVGMVDALRSPAFATSVGLLRWALSDSNLYRPRARQSQWGRRIGTFLRALLPE